MSDWKFSRSNCLKVAFVLTGILKNYEYFFQIRVCRSKLIQKIKYSSIFHNDAEMTGWYCQRSQINVQTAVVRLSRTIKGLICRKQLSGHRFSSAGIEICLHKSSTEDEALPRILEFVFFLKKLFMLKILNYLCNSEIVVLFAWGVTGS